MPDTQPDAIIFVPGLGDWLDQSTDGIARRMAVSFDRNSQTVGAKFYMKSESRDEEYVSSAQLKRKTHVSAIVRKDEKSEATVLDVYEMDYRPTLTSKYEQLNPLMQSGRLFLALFFNLHRLVGAIGSHAKNSSSKAQFYVALMIISLLIVYMVILLVTGVGIIGQGIVQGLQAAGQTVTLPAFLSNNQILGSLKIIVILLVIVQTLWPGLHGLLLKGALTYSCVIEYITYGERSEVIAGQFSDLLEYVAEKAKYRQIHIIAYSFGTIVALDTLFTSGRKLGERFKLISTLVTIGCPFDLIRMFWPAYFKSRQAWPDRPQKWLNVYSPMDALASNFRDDNEEKAAVFGLKLEEGGDRKPENLVYRHGPNDVSPMATLALQGLRAHTNYWELAYESEISCFTDIILSIYSGDLLLQ